MSDPFKNRALSLHGPAVDIIPVSPSDTADLQVTATSLFVESGGTLQIVTIAGHLRTVVVVDQTLLPVGVRRVLATGTTASGIHALVAG